MEQRREMWAQGKLVFKIGEITVRLLDDGSYLRSKK